jgi:hypothetical protein
VDRAIEQLTQIPVAMCGEPGELVMGFLEDDLVLICQAPALAFPTSETNFSFVINRMSGPLL